MAAEQYLSRTAQTLDRVNISIVAKSLIPVSSHTIRRGSLCLGVLRVLGAKNFPLETGCSNDFRDDNVFSMLHEEKCAICFAYVALNTDEAYPPKIVGVTRKDQKRRSSSVESVGYSVYCWYVIHNSIRYRSTYS